MFKADSVLKAGQDTHKHFFINKISSVKQLCKVMFSAGMKNSA